MASEYNLNLKATLDSSDVQREIDKLNNTKTDPIKIDIDTDQIKQKLDKLQSTALEFGVEYDFTNLKKEIDQIRSQKLNVNGKVDISKAEDAIKKLQEKEMQLKVSALTEPVEKQLEALKSKLITLGINADFSKIDQQIQNLKTKSIDVDVTADIEDITKKLDSIKTTKVNVKADADFASVKRELNNLNVTRQQLKQQQKATVQPHSSQQASNAPDFTRLNVALHNINSTLAALNKSISIMSKNALASSSSKSTSTFVNNPTQNQSKDFQTQYEKFDDNALRGYFKRIQNAAKDAQTRSIRRLLKNQTRIGQLITKNFGIDTASFLDASGNVTNNERFNQATETVKRFINSRAGNDYINPPRPPTPPKKWDTYLSNKFHIDPRILKASAGFALSQIPTGIADIIEAGNNGQQTTGTKWLKAGSNVAMQTAMGGMMGGMPGAVIGATTGILTSAFDLIAQKITETANRLEQFRKSIEDATQTSVAYSDYREGRQAKQAQKNADVGFFTDGIRRAKFERDFKTGMYEDIEKVTAVKYQEETNKLIKSLADGNYEGDSESLEALIKQREAHLEGYKKNLALIQKLDGRIDSYEEALKSLTESTKQFRDSIDSAKKAQQFEVTYEKQSEKYKQQNIDNMTSSQIESDRDKWSEQAKQRKAEIEELRKQKDLLLEEAKNAKTPEQQKAAAQKIAKVDQDISDRKNYANMSSNIEQSLKAEADRRKLTIENVQDTIQDLNIRDRSEAVDVVIGNKQIDQTTTAYEKADYFKAEMQKYRDQMTSHRSKAQELYDKAQSSDITGKQQDELIKQAADYQKLASSSETVMQQFKSALSQVKFDTPQRPDMQNTTSLASIGLGMGEKDDKARIEMQNNYQNEVKAIMDKQLELQQQMLDNGKSIKENTDRIAELNAKLG